eukprot:2007680-Amphidinium_carterae.1
MSEKLQRTLQQFLVMRKEKQHDKLLPRGRSTYQKIMEKLEPLLEVPNMKNAAGMAESSHRKKRVMTHEQTGELPRETQQSASLSMTHLH